MLPSLAANTGAFRPPPRPDPRCSRSLPSDEARQPAGGGETDESDRAQNESRNDQLGNHQPRSKPQDAAGYAGAYGCDILGGCTVDARWSR
jgi:hypothetical protein